LRLHLEIPQGTPVCLTMTIMSSKNSGNYIVHGNSTRICSKFRIWSPPVGVQPQKK
jgi:hypothetical protein